MQKIKSYEDYAREILGVTEPDKLAKYQKQKNRIDYQKYAANYMAEQNKNQQVAEIEKNKQKSLAESAIASERARQYVEAVNKHYGIAGTGYGESKAIDLYSEAAKRRQEINDSHETAKNDALTAYQNAITQNELTASDKLGEIELYEDEANESKRQSYVAMLQELNDNPDVSKEEFTKYYDAYKQYLGEDDKLLKADLESKAAVYEAEETLARKQKDVTDELAQIGVEPVDPITLDALKNDRNVFGKFNNNSGEQANHIDAIVKLAETKTRDGKSLLDGKAFDVNFGNGKEHYYYKDGVFYNVSKKEAEKIGIVEIDEQGNIKEAVNDAMSDEEVNRYREMRKQKHN